MKRITIWVRLFCLILYVVIAVVPAVAVTISVGAQTGTVSNELIIPITVDDPTMITGAAFTLEYSENLSVIVGSTFFDTVFNCQAPPAMAGEAEQKPDGSYRIPFLDDQGNLVTDNQGNPVYIEIPIVVDSVLYYSRLDSTITTNAVTHHPIAAARQIPANVDTPKELFSLHVSLKTGAAAGEYNIKIIPTILYNTDTNKTVEGEALDLLVGFNLTKDAADPDIYPVILDAKEFESHVVAGSVVFLADSDDDGLGDAWEMQYFGDLSHDGNDDSDNDGYTDFWENNNQTDPTDRNTEAVLPGYNPCTDARVSDILQTIQLNTPSIAMPGNTMIIEVEYDTGGGMVTSGIAFYLLFDSTKVRYAGFDNDKFLTGSGSPVIDSDTLGVFDDTQNIDNDPATDKMLQLGWKDASGQWPGTALPITLADIFFDVSDALNDGDTLVFNLVVADEPALGYQFCGKGLETVVTMWNLDIDGDGDVGALSDGLLIIRYLMGFNMGGAGWTEGFVDTNASRSENEIEIYIQSAIDTLILDIDGNGDVGALSDGLLIIRYLMGFNNGGAGWTQGYADVEATRNEADIEDYIESLFP